MNKQDGRITARKNEIAVLRALHRFGWLRTRDLAALVWHAWVRKPAGMPSLLPAKPTASAVRMAQRTLSRLFSARYVIQGRGPDGSVIYALSQPGARKVQELGIQASSGKDLVRFSASQYRHRTIANGIAISAMREGFRVSTEHEIARGAWLGGQDGIAGKRPDVLVRHAEKVYWVEVERSRKNAKDYRALLEWLTAVRSDSHRAGGAVLLGSGMSWGKIIFICKPALQSRLTADLISSGWADWQLDILVTFSTVLYDFKDIMFL